MPIHDWSRVDAGIFHDFHQAWMGYLRSALNQGVLPKPFYAAIEQRAGRVNVDVLTLRSSRVTDSPALHEWAGAVALVDTPPEVDVVMDAAGGHYALKQSSVVVRQVRGDRVVALIEVVSHGNKSSEWGLERFVDKVGNALMEGIHVAIVDLQPPGTWDPQGIHDVIWHALGESNFIPPAGKPFTLAAYTGSPHISAYVKSCRVGDALVPLPLFLDEDHYIKLPLEATYQLAYDGAPEPWREVIEGRA